MRCTHCGYCCPTDIESFLVTRRLPPRCCPGYTTSFVDLHDGAGPITSEALRDRIANKQAIVCMVTERIDRAVIDAGDRLKVIANVAVGCNNIDVVRPSRGVIVTNTPDVLTESVADFTWALILDIAQAGGGRSPVRRGREGLGIRFTGRRAAGNSSASSASGDCQGRRGAGRTFGVRVAYVSRRDIDLPGAEAMSLDRQLAPLTSCRCTSADGQTRHLMIELAA